MTKIKIDIQIDAPIEKVWECWTRPEHIIHWNFAGDDWCCPAAINDLRPGGLMNWRMESKDGSMGFDFIGEYEVVEEMKYISCRLGDDRIVEIQFKSDGAKTQIIESFDAEEINSLELQKTGWSMILGNFKKHVESL